MRCLAGQLLDASVFLNTPYKNLQEVSAEVFKKDKGLNPFMNNLLS